MKERDQLRMKPLQPSQHLVRCRDERVSVLPQLFLIRTVKQMQEPAQGRGRRDRPVALLAPPSLLDPPLAAAQMVDLGLTQDLTETMIAIEDIQIVHTVTAGEIQQDHRQDVLAGRPALLRAKAAELVADHLAKTSDLGQIQIERQAAEAGQLMARVIRLYWKGRIPCAMMVSPRW
jgi:hypothetical protein